MDENEKKTGTEEKIENETKEIKSEQDSYVPEQLDDDEFEKEKEKKKAAKAAKKAEKKAKKQKEELELDENVNPKKTKMKKSEKITIILVIIIILAIIGGVAGYLIFALNRPENAVKDFTSYISEENWTEADNLIDMQGYLTMLLIASESNSSDTSNVSYIDYENKYDNAIADLEKMFSEKGYSMDFNKILEYGKEHKDEYYKEIFGNAAIKFESANVERIGKTSLYKVTATLTLSAKDGSQADETTSYEMYVAKKDGKYQVVGGQFVELVFSYYYYYYSLDSVGTVNGTTGNTAE